jgi:hypothetical protein
LELVVLPDARNWPQKMGQMPTLKTMPWHPMAHPTGINKEELKTERSCLVGDIPLFMVLKAFETFEISICNVWSQEVSPHE